MPDPLWILVLGFFLPLMGTGILIAGAIGCYLLGRCRSCRHTVPRPIFRRPVRCPWCGGWPTGAPAIALQPAETADARHRADDTCRRCTHNARGENDAELWDGRKYCRTCVQTAEPDLWDAVRTSDHFRERMPLNAAFRFAFGQFLLPVGICISPLALVALSELAAEGKVSNDTLRGLAACSFIGALLGACYAVSLLVAFALLARSAVAVYDAVLIGCDGGLAVCRLDECRWRTGRLHEVIPRGRPWPRFVLRQRVLLLVLPKSASDPPSETDDKEQPLFAVGFTEKTRRIWKAFFNLAGVPQVDQA